jgi:surfeit locus 1 family protein
MTVLTVCVMALFVRLGFWQWHKGQLKSAQLAQFSLGGQSIEDLGARHTDELPRFLVINVEGRYDGEHQFLLDNISHNGRPGYQVLTPLQLADGRALIVNRGWVPLIGSRSQLPDVQFEAGAVRKLAGRLDNLPVVGIALGHIPPVADSRWPKLTSFPTMSDLSSALGRPLESRQLLLNADQASGFVREWQPGGFGPERYLSYAVQWWAFAALALVLYGYLNWHRSKS